MCKNPAPKCGIFACIFFVNATWWTRRGSNPRPPRCERGALPAELRAHMFYFWNVRFCFSFTRNSQIFALLYGPLALPAELRAHMFCFWNVRFCFPFTRNSQIFALLYGPLALPTELIRPYELLRFTQTSDMNCPVRNWATSLITL